ncbi:hypothetical protein C8R42DRAFT_717584 [Lentinula raphanica]|nr:hypothetical protein C8R42DRAFT_717584 [Lentinula raphanica]
MNPSKKKPETNIGLGPKPAPPPSSLTPGGSRVDKEEDETIPAPARKTRAMSKSLQAAPGPSSSKKSKPESTPASPTPAKPRRKNPLGAKGFVPKGGEGGAQKHAASVENPTTDVLDLSPLSSLSTMTPSKGKEPEKAEVTEEGRQRSETISSNDSMSLYPLILPNHGVVTARDEPISASCLKYHPLFDFSNPVDDPLAPFGIKNDVVLGLNLEQTTELREAVIRWTAPMITEFPFGMYTSVQTYVSAFPNLNFGREDLKQVSELDDVKGRCWALQYEKLEAVTHMALALNPADTVKLL